MQVRIFKPTKSAMQSGDHENKWIVEFVRTPGSRFNEELMGRTSSRDMMNEVKLSFPDLQTATAYVASKNYKAEIITPKERKFIKKSYASNFM